MITEAEALSHILKSVAPLPSQTAPLREARDGFAARDVFARVALPVFDNSAMDGYAVVAGSCRESQRIVGEQPAGIDRKLRIAPGEAVRIFTGAPIPEGADAVVMQEDVRVEGAQIFIGTKVEAGEFIRRRGSDLSEGQKIVSAGERLRAQSLSLLAAQGLATIEVGGDVRAGIITTGDELAGPNETLGAGQIYESNSTLVQALFEKCGASVALREHSADDPAVIEAGLRRAFEHHVLVIVGGVSVGARDFVRPALNSAGAQTDLWRVSVKPGKPFLFGRAGHCAIFGLPGNPVSAFVTFLLFVRPAILRMMGAGDEDLSLPSFDAQLTEEICNPGDRPHYVRGRVVHGKFAPVGRQESHALFGLSRANALLRVGPGETLARGATAPILALD